MSDWSWPACCTLGRSKEAPQLLDQLNNSMACLPDPNNVNRKLIADAAALRRALEAGERH